MHRRIAMISVHECPLASSEGKERGGINVYTFELGKALSRIGHHVDIFTRVQDDTHPRIVTVNDRLRVIHLPNGAHAPLSKKDILAALPEFTSALSDFMEQNRQDYDLIHAHYYLSGEVARQLNTRMRRRIPIVMTYHTLGIMKQLIARGTVTDDPPERIPIERDLARYANLFITSSESGSTYLKTLYDALPEHIVTIPPGVDTTLFRPMDHTQAKQHIHADAGHRIVLAVGRIDPVKGFDVLLMALKILLTKNPSLAESLCLWIVGGDVEQNQTQWSRELKKLNTLRETLNLAATVRFVAPQPQEELPYYYNAADVLVMPSHYESFGMVALEATACGTQVIATDVTGISPILKELPQGHIVSANNPLALADEIERVLTITARQHSSPAHMGDFDWDTIAKRIGDAYCKISG